MKNCKTCKHWIHDKGANPFDQKYGYCNGETGIKGGDSDFESVANNDEVSTLFTGPDFGCVHHET